MRLSPLLLSTAAVLLADPARAQAPVCAPSDGKLALILPGGGAKGFARLGDLRMLDSLAVVPDVVVGTSAVSGLRDTSRLDVSEDDPLSIAGQLLAFVFEQPLPPLQPGDVWLSSDVGGRTLDLPQFQARLRSISQVDRFPSVCLHPQRVAGDSVHLAAQAQASSAAQLLAGAAFDRALGPLALAYGANDRARGTMYLRFGDWF